MVEPLLVRKAHQPTEIPVTGKVLGEYGQMKGPGSSLRSRLPLKPGTRRNIELTTENGLNPLLPPGIIELNRTMHIPVIGHRDRWLSHRLCTGEHIRNTVQAIEEAVLGV
jgi:hypothetical protein